MGRDVQSAVLPAESIKGTKAATKPYSREKCLCNFRNRTAVEMRCCILSGGASLMLQPALQDKVALQFEIEGTRLSLCAVKGRKQTGTRSCEAQAGC